MDEDFSTNVEEPKKEKSKAGLVILLILLSAALFAGGLSIGHFVWKGGVQSAVSSATTTLTQSTSSKVELTDAGKTEMRQKTEALVE
jgi:flagellar basal body-associated protein FliL